MLLAAAVATRRPELRLLLLATTRHAAPASSDRYGSIDPVRAMADELAIVRVVVVTVVRGAA
jgi:hypothetical protein